MLLSREIQSRWFKHDLLALSRRPWVCMRAYVSIATVWVSPIFILRALNARVLLTFVLAMPRSRRRFSYGAVCVCMCGMCECVEMHGYIRETEKRKYKLHRRKATRGEFSCRLFNWGVFRSLDGMWKAPYLIWFTFAIRNMRLRPVIQNGLIATLSHSHSHFHSLSFSGYRFEPGHVLD